MAVPTDAAMAAAPIRDSEIYWRAGFFTPIAGASGTVTDSKTRMVHDINGIETIRH